MVVDSSVWLAVFLSQPLKSICLKEIKAAKTIYVPVICYYECLKVLRSEISDAEAMQAISVLTRYETLELNAETALTAADLALNYRLAMADAVVAAHARRLGVKLLTLDNDFAPVPEVKILR